MTTQQFSAREGGFSLIELLMAMSVFSFMLLIISVGFIGIVHINQSTMASRNTQQNSRIVIETLERELRSASTVYVKAVPASPPAIPANSQGRLCLSTGGTFVEYYMDPPNLMVGTVSDLAACDASVPTIIGTARQLNDSNVQVLRFVPTTTAVTGQYGGIANIEVSMTGVGTNISELTPDFTACKPGPGSQFCSVTTLATAAALRGGAQR